MAVTVYVNGHFTTCDGDLPTAAALAVRGERIIAAGSREHCRQRAGGSAVEVDLDGAWVVPGLTDSHIHLGNYARERRAVDLRTAADLTAAQDRIRAHAATLPAGVWVLGGRYDEHRWALGRSPHRTDLDAACGDRPAALQSHDGHTTWVNTAALAVLGIDGRTPDPAGGRIERDEHGPTGLLREAAAHRARAVSTASDPTSLDDALAEAFEHLLAAGITGVHNIDTPDGVAAFRRLRAAEALPVRVHQLIPNELLDEAIDAGVATGTGDPWLSIGPVKLFADGALGSHTAAMSRPYDGEPDNCGITVTGTAELTELIDRAARAGIASAVHAIGDAANTAVLDAVAAVRAEGIAPQLLHRIEHAQLVAPDDVERFGRLGVIASMQPIHCTSDIPLTSSMLGDRSLAAYAWGELVGAAAHVTFGSDAPVETFDPVAGIQAATTRRDPVSGRADSDQANTITARHALRAYTVEPAYASGEQEYKGRLAPGYLADFAVFDADLCDREVAGSGRARPMLTVVGGAVRWQRPA